MPYLRLEMLNNGLTMALRGKKINPTIASTDGGNVYLERDITFSMETTAHARKLVTITAPSLAIIVSKLRLTVLVCNLDDK